MIIEIVGNCSTGKTTLAEHLMRDFNAETICIEQFYHRHRNPFNAERAWKDFAARIRKHTTGHLIVVHTGHSRFAKSLPPEKIDVRIKLIATSETIEAREKRRIRNESFNLGPIDLAEAYIQMVECMRPLPADLTIDTTKKNIVTTHETARKFIARRMKSMIV